MGNATKRRFLNPDRQMPFPVRLKILLYIPLLLADLLLGLRFRRYDFFRGLPGAFLSIGPAEQFAAARTTISFTHFFSFVFLRCCLAGTADKITYA
jgi:hypothetical protein